MIISDKNKEIITAAIESGIVAIDTETYSLEDTRLVGFSFAYNGKEGFYVPIRHTKIPNVPIAEGLEILQSLVDNCVIIMHNSSFDIPVLRKFGVVMEEPDCKVHDTLILSHLYDETPLKHGLKSLSKRYLHYRMLEYKEVCGKGKSAIPFSDVSDVTILNKYASDDARITYLLWEYLYPKVHADYTVLNVYNKIERPLFMIVADMYCTGIKIDTDKITVIEKMCAEHVEKTLTKLRLIVPELNLNSPKQLREYFIDECKMPILKVSPKTQQPSVDREVLSMYAESNLVAKLLLEYRKYNKISSTFIPALTPTNGDRIFPHFNQAGTKSGRFSSSAPNFQTMPHDDSWGIRDSIIATEGFVLVGADYSKLEARILAQVTQDPALLEIFKTGVNFHQATADALNADYRTGKTVNFAVLYGSGYKNIAKLVEVDENTGYEYVQNFHAAYPSIQQFWRDTEKALLRDQYVETLFGRKRHLSPQYFTKERYMQRGEIRSMINTVIQGTGGEITKLAMVILYPKLKAIRGRIIANIHDEILIEVPEEYGEVGKMLLEKAMIKAGNGIMVDVPLEVDIKIGKTWKEVHG